jgi:cobalt-zinc-cadmium efflux system outer membrane protein
MKKIFLFLVISSLTLAYCGLIFAQERADRAVLNTLITEALENNPDLKAVQGKIQVFEERPVQARSLDEPRLGLALLNLPVDTFRFDQEPMTQKQVSVMQRLPFPGKLSLKGDIAEKELEIVKEEYDERKNALIMQVKVAYQNILFIDKSIEITENNKGIIEEFIKIAETKYSVGKGIQQDVLRAQLELSKMMDKLIMLKQKRESSAAMLNILLNRPADAPFNETGPVEQTAFGMTFEDLRKIAEDNRPMLIGARQLIDQYHLTRSLAEKEYYPDIDLGLSYGQRDNADMQERPDFFSASVSFKIPLWYKKKESRKVAEEEANLRKATEQYNAMKNTVSFQIKDILTEIEKYNRRIELFHSGIIPQSRASLESALSGYKVNSVDFLTLIDNQINLYNYEIEYLRAVTDHENKLAELEAAAGKRLF